MAYQSWSVVFGEQPSAAKWNILGSNDASFNDGSGFANDIVKSKHIDWADTGSGDEGGIWWEEVGRTTLAIAGDVITVSAIPARKFLMVIGRFQDTGGTINGSLTVNGDTGTNYAYRTSGNGGADSTTVSNASIGIAAVTVACPWHCLITINNISGDEKTMISHTSHAGTAGAGNAPSRSEVAAKWVTGTQISSMTITNSGTGDYAIGSELIVLGHD